MVDFCSRRVEDSDIIFTDITTNDVSIAKHGFCPKLPDDITKFLRGDGQWAAAGGAGGDHALLLNLDYAHADHTGFAPTVHAHDHSLLSNLDYAHAGHTGFAPTVHAHAESDVTNLVSDLAAKASKNFAVAMAIALG